MSEHGEPESPANSERGPSGPAAQPPRAGRMSDADADLAATVQWLRDRVLIEQLPQRYARGLDSREFDAARAVFRDDCRVKGSLVEDDIDPYWANLVPGVQAYEATMHFMGNQYVDVEPGADTGFVETYAVAYHMEPAGSGRDDLIMGVRYQDTVARDGDGWLITNRVAKPVWVRGPLPRA